MSGITLHPVNDTIRTDVIMLRLSITGITSDQVRAACEAKRISQEQAQEQAMQLWMAVSNETRGGGQLLIKKSNKKYHKFDVQDKKGIGRSRTAEAAMQLWMAVSNETRGGGQLLIKKSNGKYYAFGL